MVFGKRSVLEGLPLQSEFNYGCLYIIVKTHIIIIKHVLMCGNLLDICTVLSKTIRIKKATLATCFMAPSDLPTSQQRIT